MSNTHQIAFLSLFWCIVASGRTHMSTLSPMLYIWCQGAQQAAYISRCSFLSVPTLRTQSLKGSAQSMSSNVQQTVQCPEWNLHALCCRLSCACTCCRTARVPAKTASPGSSVATRSRADFMDNHSGSIAFSNGPNNARSASEFR